MRIPMAVAGVVLALGLAGCDKSERAAKDGYRTGDRLPAAPLAGVAGSATAGSFRELKWESLMPPGWDPMASLKGIDLSAMSDNDPRAAAALAQVREAWNLSPLNETLDGAAIRIAGFAVPLDTAGGRMTQFLLVPYFGACIHTPPPPANQIIHVVAPGGGAPMRTMMDAVWVEGVLRTVRSETSLGHAGYRLDAASVTPYVEPAPPPR